jgi:hypothetical protein
VGYGKGEALRVCPRRLQHKDRKGVENKIDFVHTCAAALSPTAKDCLSAIASAEDGRDVCAIFHACTRVCVCVGECAYAPVSLAVDS